MTTIPPADDALLTLRELSRELAVSLVFIADLVSKGKLLASEPNLYRMASARCAVEVELAVLASRPFRGW